MVKKLSRRKFLAGFKRKSFLGSAFPSVRASAPIADKRFGTNLTKAFATTNRQTQKSSSGITKKRSQITGVIGKATKRTAIRAKTLQ